MAADGIETSYRHIEDGGLYIGANHGDIMESWQWTDENRLSNENVVSGGITYQEYYDKVEILLNYAVYYTAAAMKWTIEEVKKKGGVEENSWVEESYKEKHDGEEKVLPSSRSDLDRDDLYTNQQNLTLNLFLNLATLTPVFALALIPVIMISLKKTVLV